VHHPWVPTVLQFSAPTCAALALTYNLCELNAEGFPFVFSSSCFPMPHPCPPSTATWTGRSGLPPRLRSLQRPLPKLIVAPRPLSRCPPLPLRPTAGGDPLPARAAADSRYLVRSCIHRFSLQFSAVTAPFFTPHPSSLRWSTGRSSELPPRLCSALPNILHR
jgi:hypothetical protein